MTEPAFFKEVQAQLASAPLADWKAYMRWHVVHARAPYLSAAFVQANFDFFGKYLRGTPANASALETLRGSTWMAISARRWARYSWSARSART